MIDIEAVRKQPEKVAENLARRGVSKEAVLSLAAIDKEWRALSRKLEEARARQKTANEKIARASVDEKNDLITDMKAVADSVKNMSKELARLKDARERQWAKLPNLVADDVPAGNETANEIIEKHPAEIPAPRFTLKDYLTLTEPQMVDLERAAKVSGSRFVYLKGQLARLQVGLVAFVFDQLQEDGFVPVLPPVLIGEKAMGGMGYMETGEEEIYKTQDDLYLVGTSEQSIGPMHMEEIFAAEDLPRRYVGYSTCFRREAGSHGKDVRGILRLHQFDKIEMFSFVDPNQSESEHELILGTQKKLMDALDLPYRVVKLAAGDLGAPSAKTYDIETWIPSEGKYRETHSTSNTTDYQARRLNIRVAGTENKTVKAHMLNGTALAMSRTLIALLENHQQPDGSIRIPKSLWNYVPFRQMG